MRHLVFNKQALEILEYLGCPPQAPTLRYLNQLIHAYVRKVPWESVSRIVRRHNAQGTTVRPRLPGEFWAEAIQHGFGGTCYESSLAFFSLLKALGFAGYLTVNDMGETRGCHAAITILFGQRRYLVDITIPLHAAVRINPDRATRRRTAFHTYVIQPVRENVYAVRRSHHPHGTAFTLIDAPVFLSDYRRILEKDCLESGHFNHCVVINKVIDGKTTHFFSDRKPFRLERFNREGREMIMLEVETLPRTLAEIYKMPEAEIAAALGYVQAPIG